MVPRNSKVASMLCKVSPVVFIPDIGTWYLVPGTRYLVPGTRYALRTCMYQVYMPFYTYSCPHVFLYRW